MIYRNVTPAARQRPPMVLQDTVAARPRSAWLLNIDQLLVSESLVVPPHGLGQSRRGAAPESAPVCPEGLASCYAELIRSFL